MGLNLFSLELVVFASLLISFVSAETTFFEGNFEKEYIILDKSNSDNSEVFCGNAVCDVQEDCENCRKDCGVCVGDVLNLGGSTGLYFQTYNEKEICDFALKHNLNRSGGVDAELLFEKLNEERLTSISREKFDDYIVRFDEECGEEYFEIGGLIIDTENITSENNPGFVRITGGVVGTIFKGVKDNYVILIVLTGVGVVWWVFSLIKRRKKKGGK